MIRILAAALFALALAGCATTVQTPAETDDFSPYPTKYEAAIRAHFAGILKDPDSALYRFTPPARAYRWHPVSGEVAWRGYLVEVEVNAKNSFGGYVGYRPYTFLFNAERIRDVSEGRPTPFVRRMQ